MPTVESFLVQKIAAGLPNNLWERYQFLVALRDNVMLTSEQYSELLTLTNQVELWESQRIENVVELARLHGQHVLDVLDTLSSLSWVTEVASISS